MRWDDWLNATRAAEKARDALALLSRYLDSAGAGGDAALARDMAGQARGVAERCRGRMRRDGAGRCER